MNRVKLALFVTVLMSSLGLSMLGWRLGSRAQVVPSIQIVRAAGGTLEEEPQLPVIVEEQPETCTLSDRFPENIIRWCSLIMENAQEFDLDPGLVAALMLQESGGDPEIISKDGAVGLLQVMPRDGLAEKFTCINGPCFAARPSIAELKDPQFNIRYGSRMLSGLIQRFGDLREGLKAYGPMGMAYAYADNVLAIQASSK